MIQIKYRKYLKYLLIIPIFFVTLPISFFLVLHIPNQFWGCEGFGCFGLIFLIPPLSVFLAVPLSFVIYLLITGNQTFFRNLSASMKVLIEKPFPKKKILLSIFLIPVVLLILLVATSHSTSKNSRYKITLPNAPLPTTTKNNIQTESPNTHTTQANNNVKKEVFNWKIYKSTTLGVQINYPNVYYVMENMREGFEEVRISSSDAYDKDETALIITLQPVQNTGFVKSNDQDLKNVMEKIGFASLNNKFNNELSYNFIGNSPWSYYQILIPGLTPENSDILITVRLHRQDELPTNEGGTQGAQAEMAKQILSTFKFLEN